MERQDFIKKLPERDYSGSKEDQYAQWISTVFFSIGSVHADEFIKLLEDAKKQGKKISIINEQADEITFDSLILV